MPNRNALLDRHLAALETAEQRAARQLATVYNQARREIIADLISGWNQSAIAGPADAERFLRNSGLLSQIDARMRELEGQVNLQLRGIVTSATEQGVAQIRQELALLPASIRDNFTGTFDQINNRMVERFLYPAEDGVRLATTSTALALRRELAVGVVQGEAFPTLVRRLMAATPTGEGQAVWVNGQLSAERMVRRTVISAENGAKVEAIGEVAAQIPQVRKQAIAAIGKNTTDCCLRVHGQIQPVSEPFELVGEPRFADRIMHSPFHWNCRTAVAMYHPAFEESSPTAKMQAEAKAELARRRGEKERKRQAADEQAAARVEERAAVAVQAQAQALAQAAKAPAQIDMLSTLEREFKDKAIAVGEADFRAFRDRVAALVANESKLSFTGQVHGMSSDVQFKGFKLGNQEVYWEDRANAEFFVRDLFTAKRNGIELPGPLSAATEKVYFTSQTNKNDAYWQQRYSGFTHSLATGGDGNIVVYRGKQLDLASYAHESGHNLAAKLYGDTEPSVGSKYRTAMRGEQPVSEYAKNSPSEDFAESASQYVVNGSYMKMVAPQRYAVIDKIMKDGTE